MRHVRLLALVCLAAAGLPPPPAPLPVQWLTDVNVVAYQRRGLPIAKFLLDVEAIGKGRVGGLAERLRGPAAQYAQSMVFTLVNVTDPLWRDEPARFGVQGRRAVFAIEAPPLKYPMEAKPTRDNILQFCRDFTAGQLAPFFRSEDEHQEAAPPPGPVHRVVSRQFETYMMNPFRHTVILLHSPSPDCERSRTLLPVFAAAAAHFPHAPFSFATMDVSANDVPLPLLFPDRGTPSVYITPISRKHAPESYEGPPTPIGLLAWLSRYTDHPAAALAERDPPAEADDPFDTGGSGDGSEDGASPDLTAPDRQARLRSILDRNRGTTGAGPPAAADASDATLEDLVATCHNEVHDIRLRVLRLEALVRELSRSPDGP